MKGSKKTTAIVKEQKNKPNKPTSDVGPRVEHLNYKVSRTNSPMTYTNTYSARYCWNENSMSNHIRSPT